MFTTVFASLVFGLSRAASDVLLRLLKVLVYSTLRRNKSVGDARFLTNAIPKDSRTIRSKFHLGGDTTIFAVCPKCHATYKPNYEIECVYPESCTYAPYATAMPCGEQLLDGNGKGPIKKFVYNSVLDFIGGLVSQEFIEASMDKACDNLHRSDVSEARGPFEAEFLRNFRGPETTFFERTNELRLAFALSVDFFNKEGVRSGAAHVSFGAMTLVCLNLPEHIRYKRENMFLAGVIPGPHEPLLSEISHYLAPLVEEFLLLWDPGVRFSRTASAPHGRLARAAIATVICDLPAARKVAGLVGHTSRDFFCSLCECPKWSIGQVNMCFKRRDPAVLREQALAWRDADSSERKEQITKDYGVRWSELWRLPYWDPTKQLVVDPMHCLLLGLVHNHFANIFPLTFKALKEPAPEPPPYVHDFELPFGEGVENGDCQDDIDDGLDFVPGRELSVSEDEGAALNKSNVRDVLALHKLLLLPLPGTDLQGEMTILANKMGQRGKPALEFVWSSLKLEDSSLILGQRIRQANPGSGYQKMDYAWALTVWVCGLFWNVNCAHTPLAFFKAVTK